MTDPVPRRPELQRDVERVLAEHVGPALEMDATAVEVVGVDGGVVQVRLGGVCGSCPSSVMTLIMGIEQELRKHLPDVEYLEVVP